SLLTAECSRYATAMQACPHAELHRCSTQSWLNVLRRETCTCILSRSEDSPVGGGLKCPRTTCCCSTAPPDCSASWPTPRTTIIRRLSPGGTNCLIRPSSPGASATARPKSRSSSPPKPRSRPLNCSTQLDCCGPFEGSRHAHRLRLHDHR